MKVVVTALLIVVIVRSVDWGTLRTHLAGYSPTLIAWVVVLWLVMLVLSVSKWQTLLRVHGLSYRYWTLTRWYTIGNFFNQLLPSMIGGDGYRIYRTLGNGRHRACAVLAVLLERVTGLAALMAMGAVAAGLHWLDTGHRLSGWWAALSLIGGAATVVGGLLVWKLRLVPRLLGQRWCPSAVRSLVLHAGDYARHPGLVLVAIAISFAFQGLRVLVYWLLLWGIGSDVGFGPVLIVSVVTSLVGMLPISLGGIGLVDGSFMELMAMYGVPREVGLSAMLMSRLTVLPVAIVGGVLYAFEPGKAAPPDAGGPGGATLVPR